MSGCGGCSTGNSFNPGGHYVGVRVNQNEDGRVVFCETLGTAVSKGERVIVEGDGGLEYAQVTTLSPMILKQCQLREARRLVRVANDSDQATYEAKVGRDRPFVERNRFRVDLSCFFKFARAVQLVGGNDQLFFSDILRDDFRKIGRVANWQDQKHRRS